MNTLELDAMDFRILDALQHDASLSNQALAERVHISAPTCLRRLRRLRETGLIEREIAILNIDKLAPLLGHGLTALVEITLEQQSTEWLNAFEQSVVHEPAVQQCYRVSSGPDFVLVMHCADMPHYLSVSQQLFGQSMHVRNVKTYFSIKRSKFAPVLPLQSVQTHAA